MRGRVVSLLAAMLPFAGLAVAEEAGIVPFSMPELTYYLVPETLVTFDIVDKNGAEDARMRCSGTTPAESVTTGFSSDFVRL